MLQHYSIGSFLFVLFCSLSIVNSTFVITRDVDETSMAVNDAIDSTLISSTMKRQNCDFIPNQVITFSHPQSVVLGDKYYNMGILSLAAVAMAVDYINTERCGVKIQSHNYSVALKTYSDNSDVKKHEAIGRQIVNRTDFMLAGYSSDLTETLALLAQNNSRILVAGGSSRTSVYKDRPYVFGILPPADTFLEQAFKGLSAYRPKTVAYIAEGSGTTCISVADMAKKYGMKLMSESFIDHSQQVSAFKEIASNMSQLDPDVMITCVYDYGSVYWVQAMRSVGWIPKAQVFTMALGTPEIEDFLGKEDRAFMMGVASWDRTLPPIPDEVTGWTPENFASQFEKVSFRNATYQYAAAATALSVIVKAIERADSLDSNLVREQLQKGTFNTMYGETKFDENGQNLAISLLLQYDANGKAHVIYPEGQRSSKIFSIVYPMPSWDQRDCMSSMKCENTGGECLANGTCGCETVNGIVMVPIGIGSEALCKVFAEEEMNDLSESWKNVGMSFVYIQYALSAFSMIWTYTHRNHPIVRASQPPFLYCISFGCLVAISSIIPSSMLNGDYRYLQNPLTGDLTNIPNPDVPRLDAACMAVVWLIGIGIAIVFSALFAKVYRVRKLLRHAERLSRTKVGVKDVIYIMVLVIGVESVILLSWQLVAPLRWNREVLSVDDDGFPLESIGYCSSDKENVFAIPLALFNYGMLLYALYLCWITRKMPSDLSEGSWITLSVFSIFELLLLSEPVLALVSDEVNASFFLKSGVAFLSTLAVTLFIFVPKVWKVWNPQGRGLVVRTSKFSSMVKRASGNSGESPVQLIEINNEVRSSNMHEPSNSDEETCSNKTELCKTIFNRTNLQKLNTINELDLNGDEATENDSRVEDELTEAVCNHEQPDEATIK